MVISNLADRVVLAGGFLIDDQGVEAPEELAVVRDIYVFGQPPGVRWISGDESGELGVVDSTIRVTGTKTILLPPLARYRGRSLIVVNDGDGVVTVNTKPGEHFSDGTDSQVLSGPGSILEVTAGT